MSAEFSLLKEEQSAELAGVSLATIQQYRDFGLLDPISKNGQIFYKELDIRTLFYTARENSENSAKENPPHRPPDKQSEDTVIELNTTTASDKVVNFPTLNSVLSEESKESSEEAAPNASQTPEPTEKAASEAKPEAGPELEVQTPEVETQVGESVSSGASLEMMELNKSLKNQIQILKEERDWLRERIEKLENRSEREQMLLLAESETVRNLINQKPRKPFWTFALPWFGYPENGDDKGSR